MRTNLARPGTVLFLAAVSTGSCIVGDEPGRGGVNVTEQALGPGLVCPPPDGTRPDPTVAIIDPVVRSRFSLDRVLQQLINIQGVNQTTTDFYRQLWDTNATKAGSPFPNDPHCDDPGAINDFKLACPLPDAALRSGVPSDFAPTALTNRFDLAPRNGANCGEYRIVYTLTNGAGNRDFIIFEGVLPNPNPSCGIESCRPVVKFWENLANITPNSNDLANALDTFYFTGLQGFAPAVHPGHYGMSGGVGYSQSGGQVRTNMFHAGTGAPGEAPRRWRLKENHVVLACSMIGGACHLQLLPVTVKTNPFPDLYNSLSPESRMPAFQTGFPAQVASLAVDDINLIGMSVNDSFNAGESNSQISGSACGPAPAQNDNDDHCDDLGSPPNAFTGTVKTALANANRSDLDFHNAFNRATTQTCAGCHEISPPTFGGGPLGGGNGHPSLVWPDSRGFVHIDEGSNLSPALWCQFLPFRKKVLDDFFQSPIQPCPVVQDQNQLPPSTGDTISGKPEGLAN